MDKNKPAKYLEGKELNNNWIVKDRITQDYPAGRGSFAEAYIVERNGQNALLKALDFSLALLSEDPTQSLIDLSKIYEFEKELLEICQDQKLTKVVKILDQGKIPPHEGSIIPVPYFILEYASSDVKSQLEFNSKLNTAWLLKILHNVSVGLWQLHKHNVAHTNVQPDNVLEFTKELYKLSELGKAEKKGVISPYEKFREEDLDTATPEMLYGHVETDWIYKSQATDAYLLGSLIFFLFTQSNFTTWLHFYLHENHRWDKWGDTFENALPYLIDAYDKSVYHFTAYINDLKLRDELEIVLRQLCHPDPKRRGHPKNIARVGSSLSLERYISKFDRLSKEAKYNIIEND